MYTLAGRDDMADNLLEDLLRDHPPEAGPELAEYAMAAGNLAESQAQQGKYERSLKTAMICLSAWSKGKGARAPFVALACGILSFDYWKLGNAKLQEQYLQKTEELLNTNENEAYLDTAARAYNFAARQKWDKDRNTAEALFAKAAKCASRIKWGYALVAVIDQESALYIESHQYDKAASLARQALSRKGLAFDDPRLKAICYSVLSECAYLNLKDKQANAYSKSGMEASLNAKPRAEDILLQLNLTEARSKFRQLLYPKFGGKPADANTKNDPSFKLMAAQFDLCKKIFECAACRQRAFTQAAAGEYESVLQLQGRNEEATRLAQLMKQH
jgi:hypothetical protein